MQNLVAAEATMKQGKGYSPPYSDYRLDTPTISKIVNQVLRNPNVDQYQLSGNLSWEADIWVKYVRITLAMLHFLQTTAAKL
jgi:hypothetical protein